jgi:hypothetical protein
MRSKFDSNAIRAKIKATKKLKENNTKALKMNKFLYGDNII